MKDNDNINERITSLEMFMHEVCRNLQILLLEHEKKQASTGNKIETDFDFKIIGNEKNS